VEVIHGNRQYVVQSVELKSLLIKQMFSPRRGKEVIDTLYRNQSHQVWEMGPGTVLSKLFSREYPDMEVKNVSSWNWGGKDREEEDR